MNNTDPTSFQSILAGVKRLREKEGGDVNEHDESHGLDKNEIVTTISEPVEPHQVTNSFNQHRQFTRGPKDNNESDMLPLPGSAGNLPGKAVLVNTTQKENPLLDHLKSTNWRYISSTKGTKIYYDYLIKRRSVLFLTLTYHKLYAEYIERRMMPLQSNGDNILIFIVDDKNSEDILKDITKLCMFKGFTLLLAFNFEQAAKYVEYLNR